MIKNYFAGFNLCLSLDFMRDTSDQAVSVCIDQTVSVHCRRLHE